MGCIMTQLLISFCNVSPKGYGLGIYDLAHEDLSWVDMPLVGDSCLGVDGVCKLADGYWILPQVANGGGSALAFVDLTFSVTKTWLLKNTGDAHSLIPFAEGFLVTDTTGNRLNAVSIKEGDIVETEFRRFADETIDTVHVNSVAQLNGNIYVSLFGARPEGGWGNSTGGQILDVTNNKVICEGLSHPHTVTAVGDEIWWLESKAGKVHRYSEAEVHSVVVELPGYLRGLAVDGDTFYVGASAKRRTSRSTGMPIIELAGKDDEMHSWVYKVDRKTLAFERHRMTLWGAEIYDIAVIDRDHVKDWSTVKPGIGAIQRFWRCEDERSAYQKALNESLDKLFNLSAKEAMPILDELVTSVTGDPRWEYLLAFSHHNEGNLEKALELYTRSLENGWAEFWVKYNRGNVYLTLGRIPEALADLRRAVELDPSHEGARIFLANAEKAAGQG